jgi:cephalosporin hydroxylase
MKTKGRINYPKGILLDVGCRDRKQPNFIGIDKVGRPNVDIVHDLEKFPYPIKDDECLTIKAAHIIEHIKPWLVIDWMNEMWRMLKVDGQLAVAAPYANSPLYLQDPTHCTAITERTWLYFDVQSSVFGHYSPKPWKVESISYKPDGNIETVLRKRAITDNPLRLSVKDQLTDKAMILEAIQKPVELTSLLNFIADKTLNTVVEIGSAKGGVFYALCQLAANNAKMISIDLPGGEFGDPIGVPDDKVFKTYLKKDQTFHRLLKNSHLESTKNRLVRALSGRKIDFLFIDGDHRYEGVKKDWEMYSPLVRNGGYIGFHDICFHPEDLRVGVDRLWREIQPHYKTVEFIDPADKNWGGIGVLQYEKSK